MRFLEYHNQRNLMIRSENYISGTVVSTLHMVSHVKLDMYLTDEELKACGDEVPCPKSYS